jgi:sporulation protein YlmC with PRC-barrel domain
MVESNDAPISQPQSSGWQATRLVHRPVVDVRLGQTLGEVADVVFDPEAHQLVGLLIQPEGRAGALAEIARRAFGGTLGLIYVPVEQVIALDADIVTLDTEAGGEGHPRPDIPLPRLSAVSGFAVVSLRGQRLGRLSDLLLDAEGRRIVGYLVGPESRAAPHDIASASPVAPAAAAAADDSGEAAPAQAAAAPAPSAPAIVIGADQDVRIGRDLIVVAGAAYAPAPATGASPATRNADPSTDGDQSTDVSDAPTWQRWASDAPTEQMRR